MPPHPLPGTLVLNITFYMGFCLQRETHLEGIRKLLESGKDVSAFLHPFSPLPQEILGHRCMAQILLGQGRRGADVALFRVEMRLSYHP